MLIKHFLSQIEPIIGAQVDSRCLESEQGSKAKINELQEQYAKLQDEVSDIIWSYR